MDKIGGSSNFNAIRPALNTPEAPARAPLNGQVPAGLPSFRDQLSTLQNTSTGSPTTLPTTAKNSALLKFSNHAVDRMQSRGIRFSPDEMSRIQNGVAKAQAKGSRDALLISDTAALIVSVKDNTVVTVMDKASLKDNVFTNIDSTVMV